MWCCVGGGCNNKLVLVLSTELMMKLATIRSFKANVLRNSTSSEQMEELWVMCVLTCIPWPNLIQASLNKIINDD